MLSRLLVVDDERLVRDSLVRVINAEGITTRGAESYETAVSIAREWQPDGAIVDLQLSDGDGLKLIAELRQLCPDIRCVVLTGCGNIGSAVEAVKAGAIDYCCKPVSYRELLSRIEGVKTTTVETGMTLAQVHWEHIQRTLVASGRNVSESARRLGIRRQSLQRMLQKRPSLLR